jgi:hypothetical protein
MIGAALRSLGRRYMDLSFRSGRDLAVRIVERPGLWMEDAALDALTSDLRAVAARTLPAGSLTYGVFSGDRSRLSDTIVTLVRTRDGTPVAFNALAVMTIKAAPQPVEVLHLGLVMVDPDLRSRNLSFLLYGLTCFLIVLRRQFRPVWVSNVTQVPAVVGMVTTMFSDVWPAPPGRGAPRRTLSHLILARAIIDGHRHVFGVGPEAGFDEARFVITDAYTGGSDDLKKTLEAAPQHRDAAFNAFCARELDYVRGDDLLQLGRMDLPAISRYLAREVPPSRLAGVLAAGGLVLTGKLVLPVLHWFDAGRDWSILRPAK